MGSKDSFNYNPQRYKSYLSPFGCKVLDNLIKQWRTDKTAVKRREFNFSTPSSNAPRMSVKNRKVLTFEDSSTIAPIKTPTFFPSAPFPNLFKDVRSHFPMPENNTVVPNSIELVRTLDASMKQADNLDFEDTSHSIVHNVMDRIYNDNDSNDSLKLQNPELNTNKDLVNHDNIPWNDMFGDDLLSDVVSENNQKQRTSVNVVNNKMANFTNNTEIDKIIHPINSNKVSKRKGKMVPSDGKVKKKKVIGEECKETKQKKCVTKKTDKVVKEWLLKVNSDVDEGMKLTKPKEIEYDDQTKNILENKVNGASDARTSSKENNYEVEITKVTCKNKKKDKVTIQAQLANKDGIMKFCKPKKNDVSEKVEINIINDKFNTENKVKEKVGKLKFVAPIKSQLPVKDITYEIQNLDETSIKDLSWHINLNEDFEVLMILTQTNGFCQLNCHHSEDTPQYDGVMLILNNRYYYLNHNDHDSLRDVILQVLNKSKVLCFDGKTLLLRLMSQYKFQSRDINLDIFDAKIAGCLLDPEDPPEDFSALQKLVSLTPQYTVATECRLQRSAWYTTLLQDCILKLRDQLAEHSLWNVFVNIEMKLLPIVADMERRGVLVDIEKLSSMEALLLERMKAAELACHQSAGKVFQVNSTVQVRAILYDELMLDQKCNLIVRETLMKGAKSTSETMLRSLTSVHALPGLILEYRRLHKAHATFLAGVQHHVKHGLIRPTWDQTAAVTGRIACNNPNLQAIPKAPFSLTMSNAEGKPADDSTKIESEPTTLHLRAAYVSRESYRLLAADFRHIECRVFAHAAADTQLLQALSTDEDIFTLLAAHWLNKAQSEVDSCDRERTKRVVYGSLYGGGARRLAGVLHVTYEHALTVSASFNRTFPSLKDFGRAVVAKCGQSGGRLWTPSGRMRVFRHISSDDQQLRAQAERQAVNFIVQGSAADLCKLAMVLTEQRLREARVDGHLVLQIHDELVWEVSNQDLPKAAVIIKEVMERCGIECGMSITLPVSLSQGRSWGEMEPLIIN